jgi:uncharacterized protein YjbI with pentapeptide repeats
MIVPELAIVRPRVFSPDSGEILPLEIVAEDLLNRRERVILQIQGGPGSGKTTALKHLAATTYRLEQTRFLDDPQPTEVAALAAVKSVVFTARKPIDLAHHQLVLAPWTEDDLLEYLLAVRRDRAAAALGCIRADPECDALGGNPALWREILDRLIADEPLPSVRAAAVHYLSALFQSRNERWLAAEFCLAILLHDEKESQRTIGLLARSEADYARFRLLRHRFLQQLLAGQLLAGYIAAGGKCHQPLPPDLVAELALHIHASPSIGQNLQQDFLNGPHATRPQAATILFAAYPKWRPHDHRPAFLSAGSFPEAAWAGLQLPVGSGGASRLQGANLAGANLREAVLDGARAREINLAGARLDKASLIGVDARQASLRGAYLIAANADRINLCQASLEGAVLDGASLIGADLDDADLSGASFRGADLSCSSLVGSLVTGADFRGANLSGCFLWRLVLREAEIAEARFREANLSECDLEGVRLENPDFFKANLCRALLTASTMPFADFRRADLRGAGLAEIQWENADLREADLRGCTFHMGSTRSGLVGSPYPGHGSKTGFYTDEYHDQGFKAPEEIRKANLCGADLRGAKLDDVDFYLVDLRGALFDAAAEAHLAQCGAILVERAP